jgi:hypothetical protein
MTSFPIKKSFFALWSLLALLFLTACNSDSKLINSNADLKGMVTIFVLDAATGVPVEKAQIQIVGVGTKSTSADGEAAFSDVRAGAYLVRLEKKGYETSQEPISVTTSGTEQVVAINLTSTFRLHKTGVSIKGRVFFRQDFSDTATLRTDSGIAVQLRLTATGTGSGSTVYLASVRTVKTSLNGMFSFDSLPEATSFAVIIPEFSRGGKSFSAGSATVSSGTLLSGQSYTHPNINLSPVSNTSLQAFVGSTKLTLGQPLVVEFSSPVDTAAIFSGSSSAIQLRLTPTGGTSQPIAASISWNSDLTQASILPYQSPWVANATYSVSLNAVRTLLGATVTTTFSGFALPAPAVALSAVTNPRLRATPVIRGVSTDTDVVDYATTPYRLSWNRVNGAEGYRVYYRQATDSAWQLRTSTATSLSTDTTVNLTPLTPTGKAWTRYLMILPNSSAQVVPYSLGALLTVKDGVKPALASNNPITAPGGTLWAANPALRTISLTVPVALANSQNDPLDTTKKPTVRTAQGPGSASYVATASFVWTSLTSGRVDVVVGANQDARLDSVIVDFSNVTDLNNNTFDLQGGPRVLTFTAPNL